MNDERFTRYTLAAMVVSMLTTASVVALLPLPADAAPGGSTPPPPPSWYHYSWPIPIRRSLYIPTDGTLGALALGYTEDSRTSFGGAAFYYDTNGNIVTTALAGQVATKDDPASDATIESTGVIASTPVAEFALSNGPCRGCADHPRDQTQTDDVETFEWTGPRGGRYTVNGATNTMVESLSGLPLVAPNDLSGTWLYVYRLDLDFYGGATPISAHYESVGIVKLTAVAAPRTYAVVTDVQDGIAPFGSVALPPDGSRQYDVACVSGSCNFSSIFESQANSATLWFGNDDAGRAMPVRVGGTSSAPTYTVADTGRALPRAYATNSEIVGRRDYYPGYPSYVIEEFHMMRLAGDTLTGAWQQPGCAADPTVPNCNPAD